MRAADWMDQGNYRNKTVTKLAEFCDTIGLSWSAEGDTFTITLPTVTEMSVMPEGVRRRKVFDISTWGPSSGVYEYDSTGALPDDMQMPENGEILEEGEPPKGDSDAEK